MTELFLAIAIGALIVHAVAVELRLRWHREREVKALFVANRADRRSKDAHARLDRLTGIQPHSTSSLKGTTNDD